MFKGFTPVDQGIHHFFIVDFKCFGYDSDQFLKDAPYAFGNRKLNNTIGGLVEKSTNSYIGFESFDRSQNIVLERRNGYAGNLGCEVSGLGFTQAEQAFCLLEVDFD